MRIMGFQPDSYLDWDAGLSSVIFTGKCNLACPACHAGDLIRRTDSIKTEAVLEKLLARRRLVRRVVISGGEPTLEEDLPEFLEILNKSGFKVKLYTNGTNPEAVEEIVRASLVDAMSMDIKGPKELYPIITGVNSIDNMIPRFEKSMVYVSRLADHEFRTTAAPIYVSPARELRNVRWMTPEEITRMTEWIRQVTPGRNHRHYLQGFQAQREGTMIDPNFSKEKLPESYHETPMSLLKDMSAAASKAGYELVISK